MRHTYTNKLLRPTVRRSTWVQCGDCATHVPLRRAAEGPGGFSHFCELCWSVRTGKASAYVIKKQAERKERADAILGKELESMV